MTDSGNRVRHLSKVLICIGSNWGDRFATVRDAITILSGTTAGIRSSSIYETPAAGNLPDSPPYMNAVVEAKVECSCEELQRKLKQMEINAGRNAECRRLGRVPLDMDIVEFENKILRPEDFMQSYYRMGREELEKFHDNNQ